MSYYGPPPGQPPYQQSYSPQPPYPGNQPPPPQQGYYQGPPPPMNQGYPPQHQGYGPPGGSPYPPPGGQFGPPPPGQAPYGHPPPGQYGPPGGQYGGYGGPPPPAPPTPPSPGYIPGQQSHMDMTRAAHDLRAAMKGFGTNENALIQILAPLGPLEINSVKAAFAAHHHRDLYKDVHSETSGHFRDMLLALVRGPLDQDCHVLHQALQGAGTNESALNDVLLLRSNADLNAIKAHYHHTHHRSLESAVKDDLSMKTERLFDMVLSARRAEESAPVIPQQIDADVQQIYAATEGRSGTDQMTVCALLTSRSNGQLRAITGRYHERYHRSLDDVLRAEFSGHMQQALRFIAQGAEDPAKHDAALLEDAMKGLGTHDAALVRRVVAVHWNPARLQQCKAAYRHFYHRDLTTRVRDETSGDYRKLATACIDLR